MLPTIVSELRLNIGLIPRNHTVLRTALIRKDVLIVLIGEDILGSVLTSKNVLAAALIAENVLARVLGAIAENILRGVCACVVVGCILTLTTLPCLISTLAVLQHLSAIVIEHHQL